MFKKWFKRKIDLDKVLPMLQNQDWIGIDKEMLRKTIIGDIDNPKLLLSYGEFDGEMFDPLFPKDLIGLNLEELQVKALKNLLHQGFTFFTRELSNGSMGGIKSTYFAAETILDEDLMRMLHNTIQSKNMLVSIAIRSSIMAIPKDENQKELMQEFLTIHKDTYNNAKSPVFRHLIEFKNGKIQGVHNMDKLFLS